MILMIVKEDNGGRRINRVGGQIEGLRERGVREVREVREIRETRKER